MNTLEIFFSGLAICSLLMVCAWFLSLRLQFYSLVDVIWAYGLGALVYFYAYISEGALPNKIAAVAMVTIWSLRLGTYLAIRLYSHYPTEDRRYTNLRKDWGKKKFFVFFQFQALSQALFSIPFLLITQDTSTKASPVMVLGMLIFLIGFLGESISDKQLKKFKDSIENKNKVCTIGLWKYSRHPNYFFEWLTWCGISTAALSSEYGYLGILSPILMYLTLNYLTGIPAAEEQSLQSKGELYREYQRSTNRFFPGVPK